MEIQLKGELLASAKKGHGNRSSSWISALFPVGMALLAGMAVLAFAPTASAAVIKSPANNLGLVGYWAFEDATGTKATDFSGRGNTGTLTNMDSATDWVDGKVGRALDFDGTDDYISIADSTSLNPTTAYTVTGWVKFDSLASQYGILVMKSGSEMQYRIYRDRTYFSVDAGAGAAIMVDSIISVNTWYHFAEVYDGSGSGNTGRLKLYVDGVNQNLGTYAGTTVPASITTGTNPVYLGSHVGVSLFHDGSIDEVRIYNRALSATEVATLYNSGATKVKARDNSGLLGYWSFEDATGTQATDFSGNGKTATLTGGPTWVAGKRGKAVSFDGTNDAVEMPTSFSFGALPLTMSFWTYPTSASQAYFTSDGGFSDHGFYFSTYNGGGMYVGYYISNWSTALENVASFTQNTWSHVVLTIDSTNGSRLYVNGVLRNSNATPPTGTNTTNWRLGTQFNWAHYFQGKMDDVRMYNRALTAQQVADLYSAGATTANPTIKTVSRNGLVGYWNLDDGTSTIATDFSGNGKTGTLTNGPTWVTGKRGKAVSFDGTNDHIATTHVSGKVFTWSAWFKANSFGSYQNIMDIGTPNYMLVLTDGSSLGFWSADGMSGSVLGTPTLSTGAWYHVTLVREGDSITNGYKAYLNGSYAGAANTGVWSSSDYFTIGGRVDGQVQYFPGTIDEVRIYNRALSAEEIQLLYTIGK
jgi:hypothetical protein